MLKKTVFVSILNLSSFVVQFLLNLFIAAQFGLGKQIDFYNKSISVPSYLVVLLTSCVSFIFIPLYSKVNKLESNKAQQIINEYFNVVGIAAFLLLVLVDLFSLEIVRLFNQNYTNLEIESIQLTFLLYSPLIILSTLVEFLNTILYSNNRFKIPLGWKILNPLLVILFLSFLEKESVNIALAYLVSSFMQFLVLFLFCNKHYINFRFKIDFRDVLSRNRQIIKLSAPLIFSIVLTKTLPIFDVYFLSNYSNGVVSNVILSQKLITTISFVINSFFSVLFFSQISNHAADGNFNKLFDMLLMGIKAVFFISIPLIFFLYRNSAIIFKYIFVHGKFNNSDALLLSDSFNIFVIGLPAIAIGSIISYAIYSVQNLKIFYFTSVIEIVTYVSITYLFMPYWGFKSIPFAFIINFVISDLILFLFLKNQIQSYVSDFNNGNDFIKLAVVSSLFFPYLLYPLIDSFFLDLGIFVLMCLVYCLLLYKVEFKPVVYILSKLSSYGK